MMDFLDRALSATGRRPVLAALIGGLLALWAYKIGSIYADHGLFYWIGVDFRHYYSQAMLLRSGDPGLIYDIEAVRPYQQSLAVYTTHPPADLESGTVPYPPIYAWLFMPLTLLPPPLGFALWTGPSLLATTHIAWRVAQQIPPR